MSQKLRRVAPTVAVFLFATGVIVGLLTTTDGCAQSKPGDPPTTKAPATHRLLSQPWTKEEKAEVEAALAVLEGKTPYKVVIDRKWSITPLHIEEAKRRTDTKADMVEVVMNRPAGLLQATILRKNTTETTAILGRFHDDGRLSRGYTLRGNATTEETARINFATLFENPQFDALVARSSVRLAFDPSILRKALAADRTVFVYQPATELLQAAAGPGVTLTAQEMEADYRRLIIVADDAKRTWTIRLDPKPPHLPNLVRMVGELTLPDGKQKYSLQDESQFAWNTALTEADAKPLWTEIAGSAKVREVAGWDDPQSAVWKEPGFDATPFQLLAEKAAPVRPQAVVVTEAKTIKGNNGVNSVLLTKAEFIKEVKALREKKAVTLLNYWGHDCIHCPKEVPLLVRMQPGLETRATVYFVHRQLDAMDKDDSLEKVIARIKDYPGPMRVVLDDCGKLLTEFDVASLPTTVVINQAWKHRTFIGAGQDVLKEMSAYLSASVKPMVLADIAVPPQHQLIGELQLAGVVRYKAVLEGKAFQWKEFGIEAELTDDKGVKKGKLTDKGVWELVDGSKYAPDPVTQPKSAKAPLSAELDWRLLPVKPVTGVPTANCNFIQLLDTKGGRSSTLLPTKEDQTATEMVSGRVRLYAPAKK